MELSETERAYAAGLFDGEGSFSARFNPRYEKDKRTGKTHQRFTVRAELCNTSEAVIDWLIVRFGGYKGLTRSRYREARGFRPVYVWVLFSKRPLEIFVAAVKPYLIIKREHVVVFELAVKELQRDHGNQWTRSPGLGERRSAIATTMKALNKRGAVGGPDNF